MLHLNRLGQEKELWFRNPVIIYYYYYSYYYYYIISSIYIVSEVVVGMMIWFLELLVSRGRRLPVVLVSGPQPKRSWASSRSSGIISMPSSSRRSPDHAAFVFRSGSLWCRVVASLIIIFVVIVLVVLAGPPAAKEAVGASEGEVSSCGALDEDSGDEVEPSSAKVDAQRGGVTSPDGLKQLRRNKALEHS
jgi:hypothetical protein